MSAIAEAMAMLATCGATLLVFLLFAPTLQAPFLAPKIAALELTAALGALAFALQRATVGRPRWSSPVAVGALLVLATSGAAWIAAAGEPWGAPYALTAIARWGCLFGLACGASVLVKSDRQRALEGVTVAALAVSAVGLLQHVEIRPLPIPVFSTPGSTFGNRNIAAEVIAMALPLGLGAAGGCRRPETRRIILAALVVELAYLAVTRARGAWLGATFGAGTTLWIARPRWSGASRAWALGSIVLAVVAASLPGRYNPRDTGDRKRYSAVVEVLEGGFDAQSTALKSRLGLWRRTLAMVRDHPMLGVGPGNWPVVFPQYAEPGAARDGVLSATRAPRQAHNDALERTAETGIVGFIALAWLAAAATLAARRALRSEGDKERAAIAGAAGALVALGVLSLASFPLEMPATIALAGLALGLVAARGDAAPLASRPRWMRAAPVAVGLVLLSVAAVRAERSLKSSRWLGDAERAMHRDPGPIAARDALAALRRAAQVAPHTFRTELRLAQVLRRAGQPDEAARAAKRALDIEPNEPNAQAALAAAELASGDFKAARADADRAIGLLHDYPYALELRAEAALRDGDPAAAQADRKRLADLAVGALDQETARAASALLHEPVP